MSVKYAAVKEGVERDLILAKELAAGKYLSEFTYGQIVAGLVVAIGNERRDIERKIGK